MFCLYCRVAGVQLHYANYVVTHWILLLPLLMRCSMLLKPWKLRHEIYSCLFAKYVYTLLTRSIVRKPENACYLVWLLTWTFYGNKMPMGLIQCKDVAVPLYEFPNLDTTVSLMSHVQYIMGILILVRLRFVLNLSTGRHESLYFTGWSNLMSVCSPLPAICAGNPSLLIWIGGTQRCQALLFSSLCVKSSKSLEKWGVGEIICITTRHPREVMLNDTVLAFCIIIRLWTT